jgi:hypothetical protein
MLEINVNGAATLREVAAKFRAEGNKDLSKAMSKALADSVDPIKKAIRESAAETMPREGGYQAAFDKSLRFRAAQRGGGDSASYSLATYADGTSERRDIRALEKGNLRHPIYGRSRDGKRKGERIANPWAVTSIRAGFHRRGTDHAIDEVQKNLNDVVTDYAQHLIN